MFAFLFFSKPALSAHFPCDKLSEIRAKTSLMTETDYPLIMQSLIDDLSEKNSLCLMEEKNLVDTLFKEPPEEFRSQADFFVLKGEYHLSQGEEARAESDFLQVLRTRPHNPVAATWLAAKAKSKGEFDKEDLYLHNAVKDAPKNDQEKAAQARAFERLIATVPRGEALKDVTAWEKLEPENSQPYQVQAQLAVDAQEIAPLESALGHLSAELKPYFEGQLGYFKKDYLGSSDHLLEFLAHPPGQPKVQQKDILKARLVLCRDWLELKQPLKARLSAEKGLLIDPNQKELLSVHETAIDEGGFNENDPIADLEDAAAANPNSLLIQKKIMSLIFKSKNAQNLRKAGVHLERILAVEPENIEGLYWKGFIAFQRHDFSEADAYFSRSLSLWKLRHKKLPQLVGLSPSDLFISAAENKKSKGEGEESKNLVQEGIGLVDADSEKALRTWLSSQ